MRRLSARRQQRAGLNPYMVEIANIREQCSWIHKDMQEATEKAIILGAGRCCKGKSKCTAYSRARAL